MTRSARLLALLVSGLPVVTACVTPSLSDQIAYARLVSDGVVKEPLQRKSRATAVTLNAIIPGTGHFYLEEFGAGGAIFLSNVIWPASMILGIYAARADTDVINQRYTVEYYLYGPGRPEVERAELVRASELALKYLDAQKRAGRSAVEQREITDLLLRAGFIAARAASVDWAALEATSGVQILSQPALPTEEAKP